MESFHPAEPPLDAKVVQRGSGRIKPSAPIRLDDQTIEELKSLGYLK